MRQAERRAAPKPACVPSGDRPMYSSDEGSSFPVHCSSQPSAATARFQRAAMLASTTPMSDSTRQPPRAIEASASSRAPRVASTSDAPCATSG